VKRLVPIGTVIVVALVAATVSSAVTPPARVVCGGGSTTVLFWPQGHAAIPSVNFPAFGPPHIEVYKSGARYPDADFRGFVGPGGGSWGQQCRPTSGVPSPSRVRKAKKLTTAAALVCRLKSPAVNLERVDGPGRSTLKIFVGSDLYVAAVVQVQGSFVTYNATLCTPKLSPS
jgi:hypothetical protein